MTEKIKISPDGEYSFEDLLALLPEEGERRPLLSPFLSALDFIRGRAAFVTSELQRALSVGYGDVCRVADALCALNLVDRDESDPCRYTVIYRGEEEI